jgi:large subunit ribosomal protein L29
MKGTKAVDLREWTIPDLHARVTELEEERFRLHFRSATEPLEEPLRLRTIRKDIARLHTVINEKRRGVTVAAPAKATAATPKSKKTKSGRAAT